MKLRAGGRLVTVLAAATLGAASTSAGAQAHDSASALPAPRTTALSQHGLSVLVRLPWHETRYTVDGEEVRVSVSLAYASDPQAGQRWAEFFASLPHNSELAKLDAYVAPLDEVQKICGDEALGCYGGNHLVTIGEANRGVTAQSVATHEYGHHIAANRDNAPWPAFDWGTKRWASMVGVCGRVSDGTAFPGDEGPDYPLNPGEAFAETYRVLAESDGAAEGYEWPIVDASFRPDAAALAAVRADVLQPWSGPTVTTIHGRFAGSSRSWSTSIATPLDGDLRIRISPADELTVAASAGAVLARGHWTGSGGKELDYRVCGEHSVALRVTRTGGSRFTLRISRP